VHGDFIEDDSCGVATDEVEEVGLHLEAVEVAFDVFDGITVA
jgi:hypothetical protein